MTRVLVVDDHEVVRRGLIEILAGEPSVVTGEAANAREALEQVQRRPWQVVVMDINLPDRNGLELLGDVKRLRPRLPVLVLSMYPEEQFAVRALKAGAAGYLTKAAAAAELAVAVRTVARGRRYLSASVADRLADRLQQTDRPAHEQLSDREFHVLRLIASGMTASEIARDLRLSVKTVSTYRARLLEKMGMKTNAQLTAYAVRQQLVD